MLQNQQNNTGRSESDLIKLIAQQLSNRVPIDIDLWDTGMVASYLKRSPKSVSARVITLPSFPKAIRLPSEKGKKSHPLFKAKEVIEWAENFQDKN